MALLGVELETLVSEIGDYLTFPNRMNGWSDSVPFKLDKHWQFRGNISLKMNLLSIKI